MTLYEYRMQDEDAQLESIWAYGKFVDNQLTSETKYILYPIDHFFVKVKWDIAADEIIGRGAFIEGDSLDKYSTIIKEI